MKSRENWVCRRGMSRWCEDSLKQERAIRGRMYFGARLRLSKLRGKQKFSDLGEGEKPDKV